MVPSETLRIGVDTGGTFTDLVLDAGDPLPVITHKLLSTPDDPARAVLNGIAAVLAMWEGRVGHHAAAAVPHVVHGSTVATNAVLEGKGARTAFVTTEGFEDTLHLARQNRPDLYALAPSRPQPPVARAHCFGVRERLRYDGAVLVEMDAEAIEKLVVALRETGVESIAVSLLHSYANPEHEQRLAAALRAHFPDIPLTVSHEILPEFREYERAATCIVNAVVAPPMNRYVGRLADGLGADRLRIMASGGGSLPPDEVRRKPVQTILSGPAGGALGARAVALSAGESRIIAFDMGGTSTDVALCDDGLARTTESEIGGMPIRLPMIDIHTVGAGGGSVAWIDAGGALHVGPESMGADPGPACYGRQSPPYRATVTDAHVVLGNLPTDHPLSGDLWLDKRAAREAVDGVARAIGLPLEDAARGILRIAEVTMARAVQRISVERGHDPREFVLVPFGGAGALHACSLADVLGMRHILVPPFAGVLSALGMLSAAPLYHLSRSVLVEIGAADNGYTDPREHASVADALSSLTREATQALDREKVPAPERRFEPALDLRYRGQSYELTIPLGAANPIDDFEQRHQTLYGYTATGAPVEVVTARVRAAGTEKPVRLASLAERSASDGPLPLVRVEPAYRGMPLNLRHVRREALRAGDQFQGPALITEYSATTVVAADWRLEVGPFGHLRLTRC